MKSVILCSLIIVLSTNLCAQQDSYIQVKAEPNIKVYLNDEFKGVTSEELTGLIIEKLKAGTYQIRVDKEGFTSQSESIILNSGEVKIYQVKPFVPQYRITQSGNKQQQTIELKTGSLKIQSLPAEILIEIAELNIKSLKSDDVWNVEEVPIGLYKVKFTWGNKVLFDTIRVEQNKFKHIFANFINGKVEIRSNENYHRINSEEASYNTPLKTGVLYDLPGRSIYKIPAPKYDSQSEGRIVVEVSVDRQGKVIQAIPGTKGSTTLDEYLLKVSREAALDAVFESNPSAPLVQKGTITYNFILK